MISNAISDGVAPRKGKEWRQAKGQRMGGGGERPDWGDAYQGKGPGLPVSQTENGETENGEVGRDGGRVDNSVLQSRLSDRDGGETGTEGDGGGRNNEAEGGDAGEDFHEENDENNGENDREQGGQHGAGSHEGTCREDGNYRSF